MKFTPVTATRINTWLFLRYGSGNQPQVHNLETTGFREFNCLHRDLFLCVIPTALLTGVLGSARNPSMTCEESLPRSCPKVSPSPSAGGNRVLRTAHLGLPARRRLHAAPQSR